MNKKGFTLIEFIIVFCIIGIISAIAIPNIIEGAKKKSHRPSDQDISKLTKELAEIDNSSAKVTLIAEIDGYKLYTVKSFSGEIHILIPPKYTQDVAKIVE